jgi:hypothetical protein
VAISVATGAVLIEASHLGFREAGALGLHGWSFHLATQGFYLAANVVTFLGRFLIFNFVLFADRTAGAAGTGSAGTAAARRGLPGRLWRLALEFARFGVVGGCAWLVADAVFKFSVWHIQTSEGPLIATRPLSRRPRWCRSPAIATGRSGTGHTPRWAARACCTCC